MFIAGVNPYVGRASQASNEALKSRVAIVPLTLRYFCLAMLPPRAMIAPFSAL